MGRIEENKNKENLFNTCVTAIKRSHSMNNISMNNISSKQLKRVLSKNRLTSKFGAENLYNLKRMKSKSNGSITILKTDSIYNQQPINSNLLQCYFSTLDDESKNVFR